MNFRVESERDSLANDPFRPELLEAYLRSIQTLLGHENLNTTQTYAHVTIQRLREVHDKTHSGAKDRKTDVAPILILVD